MEKLDPDDDVIVLEAAEVQVLPSEATNSGKLKFKCIGCCKNFLRSEMGLYRTHLEGGKCLTCPKTFACDTRRRQHKERTGCSSITPSNGPKKKKRRKRRASYRWENCGSSDENDSSSQNSSGEEWEREQRLEKSTTAPSRAPPVPKLSCKHCKEEFQTAGQLHYHKVCRQCDECLTTFNCMSELQRHQPSCVPSTSRTSPLPDTNVCKCDQEDVILEETTKCNFCDKKFCCEDKVGVHVREESVRCPDCRQNLHAGILFEAHRTPRSCIRCKELTFSCQNKFYQHLSDSEPCRLSGEFQECPFCAKLVEKLRPHLDLNFCTCGATFACMSLMQAHRSMAKCLQNKSFSVFFQELRDNKVDRTLVPEYVLKDVLSRDTEDEVIQVE